MKNATTIYDRISKSCDSVPFKEIQFTGRALIKLYWTKRQGSLGYQVHCVVHDFTGENVKMHYFKTGGFGFCKDSDSYWRALRCLDLMTRQDKGAVKGGASIDHKYHIGGNFYRVPKSEQIKYK